MPKYSPPKKLKRLSPSKKVALMGRIGIQTNQLAELDSVSDYENKISAVPMEVVQVDDF